MSENMVPVPVERTEFPAGVREGRESLCEGDVPASTRRQLAKLLQELGGSPDCARPSTNGPAMIRRMAVSAHCLLAVAFIAIGGATPVPAQAAAATPIACGAPYTVERGDTLFKIAERAYQDGWQYKRIYEANRNLLPNAASIEIGLALLIPCLDGHAPVTRNVAHALGPITGPAAPGEEAIALAYREAPDATGNDAEDDGGSILEAATRIAAMVAVRGSAVAAAPPADASPEMSAVLPEPVNLDQNVQRRARPVRLLTGSGFAPYADDALSGGGMIAELLSRAVEAATPDRSAQVTFVTNWGAHQSLLRPSGEFDVAFPWIKPDCGRADQLGETMRQRCTALIFSRPIYEIKVGFYAPAGDTLVGANSFAALSGKRVCRPTDHVPFDLDQTGHFAGTAELDTRWTAAECFARLVAGQTDVVTVLRTEGDMHIRSLDGTVIELDRLRSAHTLHAVASRDNPNALADLEIIDRGLAELMSSGRWFEIVAAHPSRQVALLN